MSKDIANRPPGYMTVDTCSTCIHAYEEYIDGELICKLDIPFETSVDAICDNYEDHTGGCECINTPT